MALLFKKNVKLLSSIEHTAVVSRLWQINIDSNYFWNQVRPAAVSGRCEYIHLLCSAVLQSIRNMVGSRMLPSVLIWR